MSFWDWKKANANRMGITVEDHVGLLRSVNVVGKRRLVRSTEVNAESGDVDDGNEETAVQDLTTAVGKGAQWVQ